MNRFATTLLTALASILAVASCNKAEKTIEPKKLDTPVLEVAVTGIDNATLLWELIDGAGAYRIIVNDETTLTVKGDSYTINNLSSNTDYSVKMKALAPEGSKQWLDSDLSAAVSFRTEGKKALDKPVLSISEIRPSGFTVSWNAVKKAGKYAYKVGDGAEYETTATSAVINGLSYSTNYTVKVKALPGESTSATSLESEWAEAEATTIARITLDTPVLADSHIHTNGFTLTWDAIANAGQYKYKLNGGPEQSTTENQLVLNGLSANTEYTVEVCAAPSEAGAVDYLASPWTSKKVTTSDLVALSAPVLQSKSILATEFTVVWAAIEHASAYMYSINDGAYSSTTTTSAKFDGLTNETNYTVKIYAVPSDADRVTYKDSPISTIVVRTKRPASEDDKNGDLSNFDEKPIF